MSDYRAIKIVRDLKIPGIKEAICKQYPFGEMEPGDKFVIERPKDEVELSLDAPSYWRNKTMHNIQSHITRFKRNNPEQAYKKFVLRNTIGEDGAPEAGKSCVTCWRVDGLENIEE